MVSIHNREAVDRLIQVDMERLNLEHLTSENFITKIEVKVEMGQQTLFTLLASIAFTTSFSWWTWFSFAAFITTRTF